MLLIWNYKNKHTRMPFLKVPHFCSVFSLVFHYFTPKGMESTINLLFRVSCCVKNRSDPILNPAFQSLSGDF